MWPFKWKFQSVELSNIYIYAPLIYFVLKGDSMVRHYIGLNQMRPDRISCLDLSANDILQDKNSVWSQLNWTYGSVWSHLNWAYISVWTNLNGAYSSVCSHLRFHTQSAPTKFPHFGISSVPLLLCKKCNNKTNFKYNSLSWNIYEP